MHVEWLLVKQPVENAAERRDRWFAKYEPSACFQHARRLCKEQRRAFKVMQHIDHGDIGEASLGKRQPLRVADQIEPGRLHNIAADRVWCEGLKVAGATTDLENGARDAGC